MASSKGEVAARPGSADSRSRGRRACARRRLRRTLGFESSRLGSISRAGGVLGWNLGHNDFTTDDRVSEYVGLHVSLTGVRGLFAPLIGVAAYGLLDSRWPGAGPYALLLPATLTTAGMVGFLRFDRALNSE